MSQVDLNTLPIYNQDTPGKSGLYLGLFHGRDDLEKSLDDWGSNGPIIGPLNYVHTTYNSLIKLDFENFEDISKYGFDPESMISLNIDNGMILFQEHWYGDWTVYFYKVPDLPNMKHIQLASGNNV